MNEEQDKPESKSEARDTANATPQASRPASTKIMLFLDEVEAELQSGNLEVWQEVFTRIDRLGQQSVHVAAKATEDTEMAVEVEYQELQSHLIRVRQAVAQAIATEKQIEQSAQKNHDQANTWQNRADMALKQNNPDLADQAMQRMRQYREAAVSLQEQASQQKIETSTLRQQLTDLEGIVQKAYCKKQLLIARQQTARSMVMAREVMANFNSEAALEAITRLEENVKEWEAKASATELPNLGEPGAAITETCARAIATFEEAIRALRILQDVVATPPDPASD